MHGMWYHSYSEVRNLRLKKVSTLCSKYTFRMSVCSKCITQKTNIQKKGLFNLLLLFTFSFTLSKKALIHLMELL